MSLSNIIFIIYIALGAATIPVTAQVARLLPGAEPRRVDRYIFWMGCAMLSLYVWPLVLLGKFVVYPIWARVAHWRIMRKPARG